MVYPDLTFLLNLLAKGEHSEEAGTLLRDAETLPLTLSIVHRVQVENSLVRFLYSSEPKVRATARDSLLVWQQYLHEEVFTLREFDLSAAFAQSAAWNAASELQPPRWQLSIHVAIAATAGATFASFEPTLRHKASQNGLTLLPPNL